MALKILRAEEPIEVKQLVVVIYGAPGLGKSTLGFTAEKPILLDFDKGCYRAANRKDSVTVESWQDAASITAEDLQPYKTVIVDTAGRALDFLSADIIQKTPKMGNGGALTLQGYGALKGKFTAWLNALKVIGKDVVLIAHSSEEKKGDDILERLDVQGGSKGEIYKSADAMGRLYLVNGKRTLSFSPTDTAFGKNPGNMDAILIPHPDKDPHVLATVISSIKERLNQMTETQRKRQNEIAGWLTKFQDATSLESFNKAFKEAKEASEPVKPVIKGAMVKLATEKGFTFDKKAGEYVSGVQA